MDTDHPLACGLQHPPPDHAERLLRRGLVEHRGGGCPPVDQDDLALLVAKAETADVPRVLIVGVEATEDEPLVGGVDDREAPGRLEHDGIALHQAALVADQRPGVPLSGQGLRGRSRGLEPGVDLVHDGLLVLDLLLDKMSVVATISRRAACVDVCHVEPGPPQLGERTILPHRAARRRGNL